jgi:hypothetical protein
MAAKYGRTETPRIEESHGDTRGAAEGAPTRLERISRRAYEIYEGRGGEQGRSLDDWLQAEREIDRE